MAENRQTPYALITGATAGIGWELAQLAAREGTPLILVARDETRLQQRKAELAERWSVPVHIISQDLSREGAAQDLFDVVQENRWPVDTLVNNAGFGTIGEFLESELARDQAMVRVNVLAVVELCKLFGWAFREQGGGRILNVASTAAYIPGPRMAVYYATKAFVLSFSEALYYEFKPYGIRVTALVPGPTRTEFQARAGMKNVKLTKFLVMMNAAEVARAGWQGLKKGKRVVIPGIFNKLSVYSTRLMLRAMNARIIGWLQG